MAAEILNTHNLLHSGIVFMRIAGFCTCHFTLFFRINYNSNSYCTKIVPRRSNHVIQKPSKLTVYNIKACNTTRMFLNQCELSKEAPANSNNNSLSSYTSFPNVIN